MTNAISGYAAIYNEETVIAGAFRERLAPGCFSRSLKDHSDVLALLAHDQGRVLGRVSAGTLDLRDDRIGLYFWLRPDPTTPSGQEALGTVGRQDVKGCSFAMTVVAEEWRDDGQDLPLRTITEAALWEVSLVGMPAYETTSAAVVANRSKPTSKAEAAMRSRGIPLR
ncbi:phage prohead protein [Rhizobium sp. AC44/96]|uniref:HK97 family phage prohead protease n=1 Tax=Rhizobium sp. AC44/96 TaxID=1841654 RepID=UPI00080F8F6C|nr:HK97 family phage prohead protease [Rhizobium sp. AC44/96]OCJ03747.1 phage prohead protein [Rhizobium sp. AC44/96]